MDKQLNILKELIKEENCSSKLFSLRLCQSVSCKIKSMKNLHLTKILFDLFTILQNSRWSNDYLRLNL